MNNRGEQNYEHSLTTTGLLQDGKCTKKNSVEASTDDCGVREIKVPKIPEFTYNDLSAGEAADLRALSHNR